MRTRHSGAAGLDRRRGRRQSRRGQTSGDRPGIAERVLFLGFRANPYPFIRHASLLVLSSDSEGFGNVLVESLLCGTPVVSTRCPGGPAEILEKAGMANALAELNEASLAEKWRRFTPIRRR